MTKVIGFYTDKKHRVRPITAKSKRGYSQKPKLIVRKNAIKVPKAPRKVDYGKRRAKRLNRGKSKRVVKKERKKEKMGKIMPPVAETGKILISQPNKKHRFYFESDYASGIGEFRWGPETEKAIGVKLVYTDKIPKYIRNSWMQKHMRGELQEETEYTKKYKEKYVEFVKNLDKLDLIYKDFRGKEQENVSEIVWLPKKCIKRKGDVIEVPQWLWKRKNIRIKRLMK